MVPMQPLEEMTVLAEFEYLQRLRLLSNYIFQRAERIRNVLDDLRLSCNTNANNKLQKNLQF